MRRARPKCTLGYVFSAVSQLTGNIFLHDSRRGPSEECCLHYTLDADTKLTCLHPKAADNRQLCRTPRRDSAPTIIHSHVLCIDLLKTDVIPLFPFLFPSNGYLFTCTGLAPHYCLYTVKIFLFQLFVHYGMISG
jgi:hypothetical protein